MTNRIEYRHSLMQAEVQKFDGMSGFYTVPVKLASEGEVNIPVFLDAWLRAVDVAVVSEFGVEVSFDRIQSTLKEVARVGWLEDREMVEALLGDYLLLC